MALKLWVSAVLSGLGWVFAQSDGWLPDVRLSKGYESGAIVGCDYSIMPLNSAMLKILVFQTP